MFKSIKEKEVILPGVYRSLFDNRYRIKVYEGGRYGLKSHSIARALLLKGRQAKHRILCAREVQKTIKDSVHKLLSDLIKEYEMNDYTVTDTSIINKDNGTEFIFYGLKSANVTDITKIKSLEGITITWVEEAQAITTQSLDVLIPTVIRTPGYEIIFSLNRHLLNDPVWVKYCKEPDNDVLVQHVCYTQFKSFFDDINQSELYQQICKEAERDKAIDQDKYGHIWLGHPYASSRAYFDVRSILDSIDFYKDQKIEETRNNEDIVLFEKPNFKAKYVIGADVAEGLETGDYSHAVIYKVSNWNQVGYLHCHYDPHVFAQEIYTLAKYYNNAFVAVERNNHGHAVCLKMYYDFNYHNCFKQKEKDKLDCLKTKVGWLTTEKTKYTMLTELNEAIMNNDITIRDVNALQQLLEVTRDEQGRVDVNGKDMVVAHAIAWQMRKFVSQSNYDTSEYSDDYDDSSFVFGR